MCCRACLLLMYNIDFELFSFEPRAFMLFRILLQSLLALEN